MSKEKGVELMVDDAKKQSTGRYPRKSEKRQDTFKGWPWFLIKKEWDRNR